MWRRAGGGGGLEGVEEEEGEGEAEGEGRRSSVEEEEGEKVERYWSKDGLRLLLGGLCWEREGLALVLMNKSLPTLVHII